MGAGDKSRHGSADAAGAPVAVTGTGNAASASGATVTTGYRGPVPDTGAVRVSGTGNATGSEGALVNTGYVHQMSIDRGVGRSPAYRCLLATHPLVPPGGRQASPPGLRPAPPPPPFQVGTAPLTAAVRGRQWWPRPTLPAREAAATGCLTCSAEARSLVRCEWVLAAALPSRARGTQRGICQWLTSARSCPRISDRWPRPWWPCLPSQV